MVSVILVSLVFSQQVINDLLSAVLNKLIYICFPSVNAPSQVWHSGSGLLLKGGKYSQLHSVRFWQAQLLYPDSSTEEHGDVLPCSLGGAAR